MIKYNPFCSCCPELVWAMQNALYLCKDLPADRNALVERVGKIEEELANAIKEWEDSQEVETQKLVHDLNRMEEEENA